MEHKEEKLSELMKMSKLEMPFHDFDEQVMAKIQAIEEKQKTLLGYRKNALIFFILGTILGAVLNSLIPKLIADFNMDETLRTNILLFSQLMYVLLILLLSDKIIKLIKMKKLLR